MHPSNDSSPSYLPFRNSYGRALSNFRSLCFVLCSKNCRLVGFVWKRFSSAASLIRLKSSTNEVFWQAQIYMRLAFLMR